MSTILALNLTASTNANPKHSQTIPNLLKRPCFSRNNNHGIHSAGILCHI